MTDRAVSEIMGFVLVFSLMLSTVSIVYVFGFSGLQQARDQEQLTNAERAFDVLDDNVDDIHQDGAPSRATEFRLYDAHMGVGESTQFNITVTNVVPSESNSIRTYPIVYSPQRGPTTLQYISGGVVREDRNGAVFYDEPSFLFRENESGVRTAAIPLIETRSRNSNSIAGSTTVLVHTELARQEVMTARTDAPGETETGANRYDVQFNVTTTPLQTTTWESYLESELEEAYGVTDPCSVSGETVVCNFSVERLYVSVTRIDVSIVR